MNSKVTLSFSCIGHNEKEHLEQLIPELIKYGDEVIYVDCESNDNSYEYAKQAGCKVYKRPNNSNLNINKSFGIEQTKGDWVFYIDPDERITPELMQEILQVISSNPKENGFKLARRNFFFGRWLKYGGQYPDHQLRLFRSDKGSFANIHVHERLHIDGKTGQLKNYMIHHPYISVSQFIQKFDFYTSFDSDFLKSQNTTLSVGNGIKYLLFKPWTRFFKRYLIKRGYKDGIPGFFAALFDAVGWAVRYIKLWESQKGKNVLSGW